MIALICFVLAVLASPSNFDFEWRRRDRQNETKQPDRSASLGDSITSSSIHVKMNPELHQIESKLHAEKQARAKTCSTTASSWHPVPAIDSSLSTKCLLGRAVAPLRRRSIGFRSRAGTVPQAGVIPMISVPPEPVREGPRIAAALHMSAALR
jgi:hypothetical protein